MIQFKEYLVYNNIMLWEAVQKYITENEIDNNIILTYSFGEKIMFHNSFIEIKDTGVRDIEPPINPTDKRFRIYGYTYLSEVAITHCEMQSTDKLQLSSMYDEMKGEKQC